MRPLHNIPVLALVMALALGAAAVRAEPMAPVMPLASRSLLLDITAADQRLVVAGERGHILYSDDTGTSWTQARVPTTQMLTGLHFIDAESGWAVGHDGLILASGDGGETWRVQRDGLSVQHQANLELRENALHRIKALKAALAIAPEDTVAELERQLEDAQFDLEDAELALDEPVHTAPLMDTWFQDDARGWAVGAFGTLVTTTDGGQHWASRGGELDNPMEFHLNAVTGDGKGRVFIAGEGGMMFRSVDSGETWESIEPVYDGSFFGLVYDAEHDVLIACGLQGNLFRSEDFGATWEVVETDSSITLAGGSADDGHIVVVGGVGTVLVSSDGGKSFQRIMIRDRLSLSSGLRRDDTLILVGQGGARVQALEN
jgi:photosystem II stability/assembly factor-like uncharacterized protein